MIVPKPYTCNWNDRSEIFFHRKFNSKNEQIKWKGSRRDGR